MNNKCIIAKGNPDGAGYAREIYKGHQINAHRAAWMKVNGDIPEGMLVCHHCDVKMCINVDHLYLATNQQNLKDAVARKYPKGFMPLEKQKDWHGPARGARGQFVKEQ